MKNHDLVGRVVTAVRPISDQELLSLMWPFPRHRWETRPSVIEFDDGTIVLASADDELNAAGLLLQMTAEKAGVRRLL